MAKDKTRAASVSVFFRKNWQVIYAAVLILLVPVTIVMNTFFVINRFSRTVDVELQRTALLIGKMLNVTSTDIFSDTAALQERIEKIAEVIPEVRSMDILAKDGEDFQVVASLYEDSIGRPAHGRHNILAWYDDQAIAYLTKSARPAGMEQTLTPAEARSEERFWGVVMPLHDQDDEKMYLLSTKISLDVIDSLVRDNLFWSYIWLAITVLIVVLVLSSNTRLFQYATLYKKLKEVDQMKDDFISMASHELRAPITAVRGYLSLFLEGAFGQLEEKPNQILKTTFQIATHLNTLVEDLLEVSRLEQGRLKVETAPLSAEEVVDEVVEEMSFEAEKKKLAFGYKRPAEPLPKINVDRSRFKQVIINFVSNAIKYTPSGSVTVTTEVKDDGMLEIKVTDTGLGMSAEQREKLFQKFYRVKTDQTRDIPGTGLGLWITHQIVELMKGRIYVDSIEKVGTQISVSFPIIRETSGPEAGITDTDRTADQKAAETGPEKDEATPEGAGQG
ncbi:hypothetical protein AMJ57_04435 [Parcubacteria bacterium SG8_24]|nr:MAG: hypothetical protein AMJ57_04435 [Parcubacteria bacterium SG8_24]